MKGRGVAFKGGSLTVTPGEDAFGNKRIIDRMENGMDKVIDWFNPSKASGQDINDFFKTTDKSGVYSCPLPGCPGNWYDSLGVTIPTLDSSTLGPRNHRVGANTGK